MLLGYRDEETPRLAQTILSATDTLARNYQVQPPALWHNFLVNVGMRDRGLCCHWTQDLLRKIEALQLQKYHAVWAVSRHGTWREHSCVIITAAGQGFEPAWCWTPGAMPVISTGRLSRRTATPGSVIPAITAPTVSDAAEAPFFGGHGAKRIKKARLTRRFLAHGISSRILIAEGLPIGR